MRNSAKMTLRMGCLSLCLHPKFFLTKAFQNGISKVSIRPTNGPLAVAASDWTTRSYGGETADQEVLDPLIVCGPSGVGKGTIIERFMENEFGKKQFGFTTSHTTRHPRPGEIDGIHYHFIAPEDMKELIEMGKFLEHAQVHGNFYGTSWDSMWRVQQNGKRCLLDIDVQGVKRVKSLEQANNELGNRATDSQRQFKPKYVFIAPPSMELLEARLIGRGTESAASLKTRTKNAKEELDYGLQPGVFDYVVVNDDLDKACSEFERIVREMYGL